MNPEESKRQFLEEFLAQVARDSTLMKPEESSYAVQDLTAVTPDDYPPVEITEDIQRKIDEISAIARSIETRPALSEPSLPDKPFRIDYRRNLNPAQLLGGSMGQSGVFGHWKANLCAALHHENNLTALEDG